MKGGESMNMEPTNKCETPEMTIDKLQIENNKLRQELERATKQIYKLMEHINTITNIAKLVDEKVQNY